MHQNTMLTAMTSRAPSKASFMMRACAEHAARVNRTCRADDCMAEDFKAEDGWFGFQQCVHVVYCSGSSCCLLLVGNGRVMCGSIDSARRCQKRKACIQ